MRRSGVLISVVMVGLAVGGWVAVNPAGQFGISRYGITTFNRLPVPLMDLQVRADGSMRVRLKTHDITADRLRWLTEGSPSVLIIAVGWEESARVSSDVALPEGGKVLILPTEAALSTFNALQQRRVRVAIHVHSTC